MSPDDLAKILAAINIKNSTDDPYHVNHSEAPGFSLVNTPLTGSNYLSWSRSVQIALRAKKKLEFINGKIKALLPDSDEYEKWLTADSMVVSWLLNAISKDISNAFRCGESNGPMIYQIEREIAGYHQGTSSVTNYYTNLKRRWDELQCLAPLPVCCDFGTAIADYDNNRCLMQFLMGLGDEYDNVKNQVLLTDPLPSINKPFSMVLSVEKQREVQTDTTDSSETAAVMLAQRHSSDNRGNRGTGNARNFSRKADRKKQYCSKCKTMGHTIDDFAADTPLVPVTMQTKGIEPLPTTMPDYLQQEFQKFLQSKGSSTTSVDGDIRNVNFAGTLDNWIMDIGATDHITPYLHFFDHVIKLSPPTTIRLPDNSTRLVTHIGNIRLNDRVVLYNVLYVPSFSCNLLSDLQTSEVLAKGTVIRDLYYLTKDSFLKQISCSSVARCSEHSKHLALLWHARLGHVSFKRLKHVDGVAHCDYTELMCPVCPVAKQTRLSFPTSTISSVQVFDLIHVDL
ncbi:hypothetical protein K2173_020641 [Erythroxylum novogranatense]|uniref:GAG-pre-integrase domain-containing protein n=1 Tax=Erythroxylum novogranatense TaxID=1862640 RepID=A0AAV8TMP6_9ROSI|nr:hypothetical protein K2173_020641 [Erythroxylum novogranatense]